MSGRNSISTGAKQRGKSTTRLVKCLGLSALQILTYILLVCLTLAGLAGFIPPRLWTAPSVLCLGLPYLWGFSLIVALVWWAIFRDKVMTISALIALLISAPAMSIVCPVNLPKQPGPEERTFRLLTFNALYCGDLEYPDAGYSRSLSYLIHSNADVICLQEQYALSATKNIGVASQEQIDSINTIYPYQVNNNNIDVMLLSKYPVQVKHVAYPEQMNFFMYQSYELNIKGLDLTILNVHMPSYNLSEGEREILDKANNRNLTQSFMELKGSVFQKLSAAFVIRAKAARAIATYARKTKGALIICGDFNDVPASWAYRTVREAGLRDAYCDAGSGPMITYNKHHLFFHIDQVLYRGNLRPISITRGKLRSSDHYPVMARFAIESPAPEYK